MYNVDLFKVAHLDPPRTQTELFNVWGKLTRDTDGDGRNDRWAMWATLKTTWFERFYDFYPLYLANSGGKTLVTNGKVVFDNDAAVAALDLLRRGFANGSLPRSNFAIGSRSIRRRNRRDEDHRPLVSERAEPDKERGAAL
jgi:multiple sugar transport system substrate-binding protein